MELLIKIVFVVMVTVIVDLGNVETEIGKDLQPKTRKIMRIIAVPLIIVTVLW